MKKLNLTEIKQRELNILLFFDHFCGKYNLRYYLAGGTLLGAIRHKGFIPWDDDIDVCMPRNDYNRMIEIYSKSKNLKYRIKSNTLNNNSPYTNLVDSDTIIENQFSNTQENDGLWIDIFPVDGLPENSALVKKIYKKCDFYRTLLLLIGAKLGEGKTITRKYLKYILKPLLTLYGKNRCVNKLESIAAQYPYDECKYVGAITWGLYGFGERMLKSEFEQAVEVEFEGHKFPAFSCWDSYLRGLYGDYMQLPPVEKRKTHDMVAYLIEDEEQVI